MQWCSETLFNSYVITFNYNDASYNSLEMAQVVGP